MFAAKRKALWAPASLMLGVCLNAHAGHILIDSADPTGTFANFPFSGQAWTTDNNVDLSGDGFATGAVSFALNLGSGAQNYDFCFSENGFVSFVASGGGGSCNSLLPPSGNFIAPFAADLVASNNTQWSVGKVDPTTPFDLGAAVPAMRFTWNGVSFGTDSVTAQLVLLDRGGGNFDFQMDYGLSEDYLTPAGGQQGYSLGAATSPLTSGPFSSNTDYFFSVVDGVVSPAGSTVTPVPEPPTLALALATMLLAALWNLSRQAATAIRLPSGSSTTLS
jgi:hypothetical protein